MRCNKEEVSQTKTDTFEIQITLTAIKQTVYKNPNCTNHIKQVHY